MAEWRIFSCAPLGLSDGGCGGPGFPLVTPGYIPVVPSGLGHGCGLGAVRFGSVGLGRGPWNAARSLAFAGGCAIRRMNAACRGGGVDSSHQFGMTRCEVSDEQTGLGDGTTAREARYGWEVVRQRQSLEHSETPRLRCAADAGIHGFI